MSYSVVFCQFVFEGFHRWPDAPPEHGYLGSLHRHMFHFRVELPVCHDDRDIEFIELKRRVMAYVHQIAPLALNWSCEAWARAVLEEFSASRVEVSEDGENGAVVCR